MINTRLRICGGFTIIELMVVIAIISLLTGIITVNFTQSRGKTNDGKRMSDLSTLQLALERYFGQCNAYPSALDDIFGYSCPVGLRLPDFITQIPTPPTPTAPLDPAQDSVYQYRTNNNSSGPSTDYVLHTRVLYKSDALENSLLESNRPDSGQAWYGDTFTCYSSSEVNPPFDYCLGTK